MIFTRERVDLNNNGLCIESTSKLYQNEKWVNRYIACKKTSDIAFPILTIYKSKRAKQNNHFTSSYVLQNYCGYEKGFELKKLSNTLAVLMKEVVVILNFELAENLIVWETWLKNTCGQSICLFMQLRELPTRKEHYFLTTLMKDVKCHLHDSRITVVYGRPQRVLFSSHINDADIRGDDNCLINITLNNGEYYKLYCPRSETFRKLLEKASSTKDTLHRYLSQRESEGDWMPMIFFGQSHSDLNSQVSDYSGLGTFTNTPESARKYRINKNSPPNLTKTKSMSFQKLARTSSGGAQSTGLDTIGNYMNISRRSSVRDAKQLPVPVRPNTLVEENANYLNGEDRPLTPLEILHGFKFPHPSEAPPVIRYTCNPDYVNVEKQVKLRRTSHGGKSQTSDPATSPSPITELNETMRRRSDNSVNRGGLQIPRKNQLVQSANNLSKGRSMMDFTSNYEPEIRMENWRRAKKIISAFKPKSHSDLHQKNGKPKKTLTKSSSTGALQYSSNIAFPDTEKGDMIQHSSSSKSSLSDTEIGTALNMTVNDASSTNYLKIQADEEPPAGLVRMKENEHVFRTNITRGNVPAILARRLASSIRGSFSKYDGEKTTHHYQPQEIKVKWGNEMITRKPEQPKEEIDPETDPFGAAVNRGQNRLKESDRRASSVSFHKVNAILPAKTIKPKRDLEPLNKKLLQQLTSPRSSSSYSEGTRSSIESLSSDNLQPFKPPPSPPAMEAPKIFRAPSNSTLVHHSSSTESLNSQQTTRSTSPPLLPMKLVQEKQCRSSSSSLQSIVSRTVQLPIAPAAPMVLAPPPPPSSISKTDYCELGVNGSTEKPNKKNSVRAGIEYMLIDPTSTKAANMATQQIKLDRSKTKSLTIQDIDKRRRSQGQSSVTSDTVLVEQPSKQGFFRKYRKMRRDKKLANSSPQLDA